MSFLDDTQIVLTSYLKMTEEILNDLLDKKPYCGCAHIIPNLDLGFPHDVIRIAGGFATGMGVLWQSEIPFVPIDICMNVCTVSLYELKDCIEFTESKIEKLISKIDESSYMANFHRGNHFISYLQDVKTDKKYIMIHSSAAEFETGYNGLYPVESNFFYGKMKVFHSRNRYVRYLDGKPAKLFYKMAYDIYQYNENRHDFMIESFMDNSEDIINSKHYHHYGMPSEQIALLGSHMITRNMETPLLTRVGENVYIIEYKNLLNKQLKIWENQSYFLTPHGLGKKHCGTPDLQINDVEQSMKLDNCSYKIKYGESLRSHPNLQIRDIKMQEFFSFLAQNYEFGIINEFQQVASYNKDGFIRWNEAR